MDHLILVDWNDFYNRKTVSMVLKKTALIRHWLKAQPNGRQAFIDMVNEHVGEDLEHRFDEMDLDLILRAWSLED